MASGRINSKESLQTAEEVSRAFGGDWLAALDAARPGPNGVLVLNDSDLRAAEARREHASQQG